MPVPDSRKKGADLLPPATCPRCSLAYEGTPDRCPRCGAPLRVTAEELHRLGRTKRDALYGRKTLSDAFFLVGLLLGGSLMSFGGYLHLGALVVLAGALASALRRYTDWSTPGTIVVGTLLAMVAASWIAEPRPAKGDESTAAEDQRRAYAQALSDKDPDVLIEPRGPELTALWFTLPSEMASPCGEYPAADVRTHLAQLGFRRIVIAGPNGHRGLCSFAPRETSTSPSQ